MKSSFAILFLNYSFTAFNEGSVKLDDSIFNLINGFIDTSLFFLLCSRDFEWDFKISSS